MADFSILKLLTDFNGQNVQAYAKSIDNGDGMVNESNGEKQKLLFEFGVNDIEDLMLDVFKPSNIAKAKTDPQVALENAKKLAEGVTKLLNNVQSTNYNMVYSQVTYQKLSDLENDILATPEQCGTLYAQYAEAEEKSLEQLRIISTDHFDTILNYLELCENNSTISEIKEKITQLKTKTLQAIDELFATTKEENEQLKTKTNELQGIIITNKNDKCTMADAKEFVLANKAELMQLYDEESVENFTTKFEELINIIDNDEWKEKLNINDFIIALQYDLTSLKDEQNIPTTAATIDYHIETLKERVENYIKNCDNEQIKTSANELLLKVSEISTYFKSKVYDSVLLRRAIRWIEEKDFDSIDAYRVLWSNNSMVNYYYENCEENDASFKRELCSVRSTISTMIDELGRLEWLTVVTNPQMCDKFLNYSKHIRNVMNKLKEMRTFTSESSKTIIPLQKDINKNKSDFEAEIATLQSELQTEINKLEESTDIQTPEAKTAPTYDGGKYQDGKKYALENYPGLNDGLYILKNGTWYTVGGMNTGVKARKD